MKRLLFAVVMCIALISVASASVTQCNPPAGSTANVNNGNYSFTCFGLTFSNFLANVLPAGVTVGIDPTQTGKDNVTNAIDVAFQFVGLSGPSSLDVQISYAVSGGTTGVDWSFLNTNPTGSITLGEFICPGSSGGTNAGGCVSGSPLALSTGGSAITVTSTTNQQSGVSFFTAGAQPLVYIHKDLSFSNGFMSEFTNSNEIPEPLTMLSLGGGLVLIGSLRLRRRKTN